MIERLFERTSLPLVCVQGCGFVGSAMAVAVANAMSEDGYPMFNVAAVELDSPHGRERVAAFTGEGPVFNTTDHQLVAAHRSALERGNLSATTDQTVYESAHVAVVDVNLDVHFGGGNARVNLDGFRAAITELADHLPAGALILVETTVPPGTCEKVVVPTVRERLRRRGLSVDDIHVAHSYERVMPGAHYLDSITQFWRVYAGATDEAANACERFLSSVIDTRTYPMTRLSSMTASETGKVLENSYRATTIAFMEEWARFAEQAGFDLFPVIDAIRFRPTHNNMRQPGFGVGGYCLTKDPLLAGVGARDLFGFNDLAFPFSESAVATNRRMPLETVRLVREGVGGSLSGRRILLLGVSYRPDVADTRYSPSEVFVREATTLGAHVDCHDPLVRYWDELEMTLPKVMPAPQSYDAVVFASAHPDYVAIDFEHWLGTARPVLVDANRVLTDQQRATLRFLDVPLHSIGRGTEHRGLFVSASERG